MSSSRRDENGWRSKISQLVFFAVCTDLFGLDVYDALIWNFGRGKDPSAFISRHW
jgi:hypothetical protein